MAKFDDTLWMRDIGSVAAAATTAIFVATPDRRLRWAVTGAGASITSFGTVGNATDKTWRSVLWEGVNTIVHGGRITTMTAANIVTAAGDLSFIYGDSAGDFLVWHFRRTGKSLVASAFSDITSKPTTLAGYGITDDVALLASPIFTGNPRGPTPAGGDNDTSLATTAFVQAELAAYAALAGASFTGLVRLASALPRLAISETDAAVDQKNWDLIAQGGELSLRSLNDIENAAVTVFSIAKASEPAVAGFKLLTHLLFSPDNTYDIGASGATRPRDIHAARTITAATSVLAPNISILGGYLLGANFNTTADQAIAITLPAGITKYRVLQLVVMNASTSLTTAAGGVYSAAAKAGSPVIAAATTYSAITNNTPNAAGTLQATGGAAIMLTATTLYLSLTTPQGGAATADVYVQIQVFP